jgi:hypothetical protein
MLNFSGETIHGERINFGLNDIKHIVRDADLVILDRPRDVIVKFSTVEVEKYGKEIGDSKFPLAAITARLGYH